MILFSDTSTAPQSAEEQRRQHRRAERRDALTESKLGTVAEEEGRAEDLDATVGKFADRGFRLAFDAAVKDSRLRVSADGAHQQKLCGAGAQSRPGESDYEVVIDEPKRPL